MTTNSQKITFEMRASGVREVLVYCRDHRCSHHVEISADHWADHIRLSDIEPGFLCTACGSAARTCGRILRSWGLVRCLEDFNPIGALPQFYVAAVHELLGSLPGCVVVGANQVDP